MYQTRTVSGLAYMWQWYVSVFIRLHFGTVHVLWYCVCVSVYDFFITPYIHHLFSQAIILITNTFSYKCGLKVTYLCTFCTEIKECMINIFGNVIIFKTLAIGNFLKIYGVIWPFNAKDILVGLTEQTQFITGYYQQWN